MHFEPSCWRGAADDSSFPPEIDLKDTWHHAGYVAEMAVWDIANRVKDRHDETVDAMRVDNGMTPEEFLAKQ